MRSLLVAAALAVAALLTGCQTFDSIKDCANICQRYHDCFDSTYGVDACEQRCRDSAESDDTYFQKVDNCNTCIDDKACASAVFNCGADCSTVVP